MSIASGFILLEASLSGMAVASACGISATPPIPLFGITEHSEGNPALSARDFNNCEEMLFFQNCFHDGFCGCTEVKFLYDLPNRKWFSSPQVSLIRCSKIHDGIVPATDILHIYFGENRVVGSNCIFQYVQAVQY